MNENFTKLLCQKHKMVLNFRKDDTWVLIIRKKELSLTTEFDYDEFWFKTNLSLALPNTH
jgi:hypothetical protein